MCLLCFAKNVYTMYTTQCRNVWVFPVGPPENKKSLSNGRTRTVQQ